jgi:hypothetical protein
MCHYFFGYQSKSNSHAPIGDRQYCEKILWRLANADTSARDTVISLNESTLYDLCDEAILVLKLDPLLLTLTGPFMIHMSKLEDGLQQRSKK